MPNKLLYISLLSVMTLLLTSCGGKTTTGNVNVMSNTGNASVIDNNNAAKSEVVDKLWSMLSGYWKYTGTNDETEALFYFYGYNDDHQAISYLIWTYEMDETEYVTEVTALDEHQYRVKFDIPAIEEEGLHDLHEAYSKIYDFDLSRYADKEITILSSGETSEWKFIGKTLEELISIRDK